MYVKISNPMNYKVALYIRLSKEDESDNESASVTNQRKLLREFVEEQRLDVYSEYIDDGFTGTDFDRPNFNRMICDIDSKKVNMVITKDMSRLGRDYIQTGFYMEKYFPENRVRYISLLDGIDTGIDSSANDITPFKAIMNDMYAKDISKKIKSVKQYKQKNGLFIGGKAAYGYKISPDEKNKIIIDEETSNIVRRMFHLALEGRSCREIAVIFNNEKIVTPANYANINLTVKGIYSGLWSSERVTFMLKNQVYIGNMVQGRVKKVNYKSKKSLKIPPEEWIIVENTHQPIIDAEIFYKVQMLLAKRTKTRSRTYDYFLKGLVYCHECEYLLGVMNRKLASADVLYFICRTHQRFTSLKKCSCHNIRVDLVTKAVVDRIREVCKKYIDTDVMRTVAERELKAFEDKNRQNDTIKNLTGKIDNLTNHLDKIYSDKLSGVLAEDDFIRIYEKMKCDRKALQDKLDSLTREIKKDIPKTDIIKGLVNKFLETTNLNKELIFSLVERIEITKEKEVLIYFTFSELDHVS
jgi:DNA invertase Pin-like site-specific DNA recombinase